MIFLDIKKLGGDIKSDIARPYPLMLLNAKRSGTYLKERGITERVMRLPFFKKKK